jgi:hypothetical protein
VGQIGVSWRIFVHREHGEHGEGSNAESRRSAEAAKREGKERKEKRRTTRGRDRTRRGGVGGGIVEIVPVIVDR